MLIPGIPGVSDNITVRSLVGVSLNIAVCSGLIMAAVKELYIGSAELDARNLNDRETDDSGKGYRLHAPH